MAVMPPHLTYNNIEIVDMNRKKYLTEAWLLNYIHAHIRINTYK